MVQIPFDPREQSLFQNGRMPALLYAGQIYNDPNWSFPSHKHDELCEIIYVSEGEGQFVIDNKMHHASKGDLIIYNGGILHEERSNPRRPLKTFFCGIGNLQLKGLPEHCLLAPSVCPVVPTGLNSHQVENYIGTLFEELNAQVFGFGTVCQNALVSLIVVVMRIVNTMTVESSPAKGSSLSILIKEYIDTNYMRDIPLNEIANRLYISPFYLSHIFKEDTGKSPINYLIQRRIGEAKRLLLTSRLSVQEISESVGYMNANYFSTLFKKVTGQSPSEFRKSSLPSC